MSYCTTCVKEGRVTCSMKPCQDVERILRPATRWREKAHPLDKIEYFAWRADQQNRRTWNESPATKHDPRIRKLLAGPALSPNQKRILRRYLKGEAPVDIGRRLGVSRQYIDQTMEIIERKAKEIFTKRALL